MKPPWQLRYRAMTSSLMILCGITWIDFQKNHDQYCGTEFRYHKLWAQNRDAFTSMIFTSTVPSPKQKEHFYMCSANTSTFEETIRLEECNPCEIPGFVLQLDLDFLLDLAKKRPSFHDIFHY